jgi:UDP-N-acetylglucosamine 2-epimerase (non-hydrolysing)
MKRFEPVAAAEAPAAVVVVGDVNSTVACALVAAKAGIPVIHVEAGLRSFDRSMPEEINRLVTDAISDLLLVTEESGRRNLLREGAAPERIHLVGNLMIDSLRRHLEAARLSPILETVGASPGQYGLVTLHRPANVDDAARLSETMDVLEEMAADLPLLFPVHPRTRAKLEAVSRRPSGRIRMLEPLGYLDFLRLMESSAVTLTDSGGIQEETTALGVPCLTLRDNTERPVTVEEGTNLLAGTRRDTILAAWEQWKRAPKRGRVPALWDGRAAERCVSAIREFLLEADRSGAVHAEPRRTS